MERMMRIKQLDLDLIAACIVAALAGLAFMTMPGGSPLRVALALAVLFFVPGYLLIEAVAQPAVSRQRRVVRAWIAIGVSPAVVGLLALATVALPGGFRPASIVATLTVACVGLAGVGIWRRRRAARLGLPSKMAPAT